MPKDTANNVRNTLVNLGGSKSNLFTLLRSSLSEYGKCTLDWLTYKQSKLFFSILKYS